jgi:hypothetical protein
MAARIRFLTVLVLFAACNLLVQVVVARAVEIPYPERLLRVQALSEEFKLRGPAPTQNSLGSWAGIYYFTQWQLDSGRDHLLIWELINQEFTIKPFELAQELSLDPDLECEHRPSPQVCEKWLRLFRESRRQPGSRKGERWLWNSHMAALTDSILRHREELEQAPMPEEERRFWRGRTCTIYGLNRINYPTSAEFIIPIVKNLEPPCAPLGAAHCQVEDLRPLERRRYVQQMIKLGWERSSLDRCIEELGYSF